jgi:hypothetical protein
MEAQRDEALKHTDAAMDLAIGYKEAGSPMVYPLPHNKYGFMDNTEVPASWYFAQEAREDFRYLKTQLRRYKFRIEEGDYYEAKNSYLRFGKAYAAVLANAERAVSFA